MRRLVTALRRVDSSKPSVLTPLARNRVLTVGRARRIVSSVGVPEGVVERGTMSKMSAKSDLTIGDKVREKAKLKRAAQTEASLQTLAAQVERLLVERDADRQEMQETQQEVAELKLALAEQGRQLSAARHEIERANKDLRANFTQPLHDLRSELQAAVAETATLRQQVVLQEAKLTAMQGAVQDHGTQLRDVATLKAQQGFVQAAADRADLATAEHSRLLGEVRSELAGLQQRHASLASTQVAEQGSHRQVHAQLRQACETLTMQFESVQVEMGSIRADNASSTETCEKLKKAAKRHELLLHRMTEVHETRAGELRGLIKSLSEQLRPLHETSRRHASQIEEVSSGINVLAELLRFTNRNRTQTLADALHTVGI